MQPVNYGPFTVDADIQGFTLTRENGSLRFLPGEGSHAIDIINHALSLREWVVLPERISDSPMQVRFTDARLMYLGNKAQRGEVAFQFDEGDALIEAIQGGLHKFKDMNTLKGGGLKGSFSSAHTPDPIVTGRD